MSSNPISTYRIDSPIFSNHIDSIEKIDRYSTSTTESSVTPIFPIDPSLLVGDVAQIYEIKTRISNANTRQGNYSASEGTHILQNLWQEFDYYEQFQAECNEDVDLLKRYKEKDSIYQLIQVLGKDLSPLNETMVVSQAEETPLLVQNKGKKFGQGQLTSSGNVGGINIPKADKIKTPLGVPIDKCWRLHGKLPNPNQNWTPKGIPGPIYTPPSIESSTSPSNESSLVLSPIHSPFVSSPKITREKTPSTTHPLQVYSRKRGHIIQSPRVHKSKPELEIPDINEEQNMPAIEVQELPIAGGKNAMKVEIVALEKKTWDSMDLPKGKKFVGCRWHGNLEEEIFMEVPPRFEVEKEKVSKLRNSLYGLNRLRPWGTTKVKIKELAKLRYFLGT
ncbi:hypothetical protein V8G54_005406 [Vigna mungo]|uniref:Uncharacterized protein n=1 Tax=Vigna mungo TaxID=3915 RepID=A0AAQ3S3Q4_VIGMU